MSHRLPAPHTIRYVSASTTLGASDYMVVVTQTGQTVTLPSAVGLLTHMLVVKNANVKNTTVVGPAGQTIDGKASYIVGSEFASVKCISDGSNWLSC